MPENDLKSNYVYVIFETEKPLFNGEELKAVDIARLMLLSTYINTDGKIMMTQRTHMTNKLMREVVGFSRTDKLNRFLEKVLKSKLIYKKSDEYYANQNFLSKGKIRKINSNETVLRLNCVEIRKLFKTGKLSHIGHCFRLIPFMHLEHNILCHNPRDICDQSEVTPIKLKEICSLLGITDKPVIKLFNTLNSLICSNQKPLVAKTKSEDERARLLTINDGVISNELFNHNYYIYRFLDKENNIIYIGRTKCKLNYRFSGHIHLPDECYSQINSIEYAIVNSELSMAMYEVYYINKYKPKYNKKDLYDGNLLFEFPELVFNPYNDKNCRILNNKGDDVIEAG